VRNPTVWPRSNRRTETGTLGAWLQSAQLRITAAGEHISALYALAHAATGRPTAWQIAHPDYLLAPDEESELEAFLARLLRGEPLAYIIEKQSFYGRDFFVNPSVLIPRPETEQLVELAISNARQSSTPMRIADVGTGSGCIALSLAKELPGAALIATDISSRALSVASRNASLHQAGEQVQFVQCHLIDAVDARFDMVCANLPYIPGRTLRQLDALRFEPRLALDGGSDGLQLIAPLVADLQRIRKSRCLALFEIEHSQGGAFLALSRSLYPQASSKIEGDLAGKDRIGMIQFTS